MADSAMSRFLRLLPMFLALLAIPSRAHGQEARDQALQALRMEFERDGVTATAEDLAAQFKEACERGYSPACRRDTWLTVDGRPETGKVLLVFESACGSGDPVGCLVMGWMLDQRARVENDSDERDRLWRKAARQLKSDCDAGFTPACFDFAGYLYENRGIVSDPRPALARWKAACDAGEPASCTRLAQLSFEGGPAVTVNVPTARALASKACGLDYPEGCALLGRMEDTGWDPAKYDAFWGDLCTRGHRESCWKLARAYTDGIRPEPTEGRVRDLLARACDLGHPRACYESGRWILDHNGPVPDAAGLFGRSCKLGDAAACSAQVDLILNGKVTMSFKSAYSAFDVACERHESITACAELAFQLQSGAEVPRDPERARKLLLRVCTDATSDPKACDALGDSYEQGLGGDRDRTEASKYFRWSCAAGVAQSCQKRGLLLISDVGVRRDDAEARDMFGRACDGGVVAGCYEAAKIVDIATFVPRDAVAAAALYGRACDGGMHVACTSLGMLLERGTAGQPEVAAAREAYEKAIAAGATTEAKRLLARLLWNGMGGSKSKGRAKDLCREACQSGDAVACKGPAFL
jgi:uncharacterized protein